MTIWEGVLLGIGYGLATILCRFVGEWIMRHYELRRMRKLHAFVTIVDGTMMRDALKKSLRNHLGMEVDELQQIGDRYIVGGRVLAEGGYRDNSFNREAKPYFAGPVDEIPWACLDTKERVERLVKAASSAFVSVRSRSK